MISKITCTFQPSAAGEQLVHFRISIPLRGSKHSFESSVAPGKRKRSCGLVLLCFCAPYHVWNTERLPQVFVRGRNARRMTWPVAQNSIDAPDIVAVEQINTWESCVALKALKQLCLSMFVSRSQVVGLWVKVWKDFLLFGRIIQRVFFQTSVDLQLFNWPLAACVQVADVRNIC